MRGRATPGRLAKPEGMFSNLRQTAGQLQRRSLHYWRRFTATDTTSGELEMIGSVLSLGARDWIVEVGANDPFTGSMSWPLIHRGWKAILVEPHPAAFERLGREYQDNPRVTLINKACSCQKGQLPLIIGSDGDWGSLSTLCTDDNPILNQRRTNKSLTVDVIRLEELLNEHSVPKHFGVLSVDTEGMDYEVLQGLNLSAFKPRVIITEDYAPKDSAKCRMLEEAGYILLGKCNANSVWQTVK